MHAVGAAASRPFFAALFLRAADCRPYESSADNNALDKTLAKGKGASCCLRRQSVVESPPAGEIGGAYGQENDDG